MKIYIILSLLTGWLVTELKDFITIGGIQNSFAFSLLKIIFVATCMGICIIFVTGPPMLIRTLENFMASININAQNPAITANVNPLPKNYIRFNKFARSSSRHSS